MSKPTPADVIRHLESMLLEVSALCGRLGQKADNDDITAARECLRAVLPSSPAGWTAEERAQDGEARRGMTALPEGHPGAEEWAAEALHGGFAHALTDWMP